MKKVIHKNQVVITTLAVLIAIAGYVSYDRKNAGADDEAQIVANTDVLNGETDLVLDISDEDLANDSAADISDEDLAKDAADISDEDLAKGTQEETDGIDNPGETVLTSAGAGASDYAAQVKLNREQVRSKNREVLQSIIDNESLDEAQKQDAVNGMISLTDIAEKEANAEMMLEAKGFSNVVVSINEDSCDVVLDMGEVTDAKRAQVEDIVKRKTGMAAENIVITPIQ